MLLGLLLLLQDPLLERLADDDLEIRERTRAEIASRGGRAIPALLGALDHPESEIRASAARLLEEQSPLDWAPFLDDPRALRLFLAGFGDPLVPDWENRALEFAHRALREPLPLSRFAEIARAQGHVVGVVGALRHADAEGATVTWHVENPEDIILRLQEGVFFVGYRPDLAKLKPLPRFLVERLLEEPGDPQAACVLADLVSEPMERGLLRAIERGDLNALDLLTCAYAKRVPERLDPRYVRGLRERLKTADWPFLAPASVVARAHAPAVAPVLREACASPSLWARYFGAAVANASKESALYDPALFALMREKEPDLQREALFAALALAPRAKMDFAAMVGAALAQPRDRRWPAIEAFRKIPDPRLAVELTRVPGPHWDFAWLVLCAYDDDAVSDAVCEAAAGESDARLIPLLAHYAADGRRGRPIETLKSLVAAADDPAAFQAAASLAPLLREGALDFFRGYLAAETGTLRRRGVEGLFQAGLLAEPGSCLREAYISELRTLALRETEPESLSLAKSRLEILQERAPRRFGGRIGGRRILTARSSCGGTDTRIGWRPVVEAAIPRPSWK
jgi:hypothetical protein